ncbi:enoyl-CoA hydratase-related protein [Streptomyces sp. S.PB5]|uniref:enoyl-CoA hydratase/isomerase family protein n=1 Tax=Streptomyces sp. S.PB5 TaxID=3020844 RepID=UPI0025B235D7|nr:enoyl-CoA hydratase-related protein [Streptomyces sp. S.PB5]MDN3029379.1 enoyl-CoA hydratase-related protein [Streptomyces sp. S.PB5]
MTSTPTVERLSAWLDLDGAVGILRLDRPPLNVLDRAAQSALRAAAEQAAGDERIRAVVLYGGPTAFSAGGDIKEMAAMTHAEMVGHAPLLQGAFDAVAAIPKPVVAAINGPALGGGCELALTADARICGTEARLGLPEVLLGVIPGAGGTQRLPRLIGPAKAKELIFTGRQVGADEALQLGLVDQVVPTDQVLPGALRWARRFAKGPALALHAAKTAVDQGLATDLACGLAIERSVFAALFATEDRLTGMRTFAAEGPGRAAFDGR